MSEKSAQLGPAGEVERARVWRALTSLGEAIDDVDNHYQRVALANAWEELRAALSQGDRW